MSAPMKTAAAHSRYAIYNKWSSIIGCPENCSQSLLLCISSKNNATLQQRRSKHKTPEQLKLWFSRTYKPRYSWLPVAPKKFEKDEEIITKENKEFIERKALECVQARSSPLLNEPYPRGTWKADSPITIRTGLIGVKIGVVPQWTVTGKKILCTMLQIVDNQVIAYRPPEVLRSMHQTRRMWQQREYGMVIVGAVNASPLEFSEEYNKQFLEGGVPPKRKLTRFIVTPDSAIQPGTTLTANHFRVGDYVDVNARTIEMGFQGVLTRWGMKGGPASHGVTKQHRRPGGIGGGGDKGGVWKGKHMPGHMGSMWVYHRGLKIERINTKYNVLYVRGPNIPGPPHAYVRILDTMISPKRRLLANNPPPMPTFFPEDAVEDMPENLYHEQLFNFDSPTISYKGVDPDTLYLHTTQYKLTGGTFQGKNRSRRKGNRDY